ncbi:unnamed protein product [Aphanomyces euteiches]
MKQRSKSKTSLNFVAYMGSLLEQGSGALSKLTFDTNFISYSVGRWSTRSQRVAKPLDKKYVDDVVYELNQANFVVVDEQTYPFVDAIVHIVGPELKSVAEVVKLLSFLLHREQQSRNPKPCLPFGDIGVICLDTIEATVQTMASHLPSIYNVMVQLNLPRQEVYWKLLLLPLTDVYPSELRLRMIDHLLVNGCAAFVSVLVVSSPAKILPKANKDNAIECIEVHQSNFAQVYVKRSLFMRAKHFTFNLAPSYDRPLIHHQERHKLTFDKYGWIGFDVDHTLAEFKLDVLLRVSFEKAYQKIQSNYMNLRTSRSPVWLPHLAFRGIAIDIAKGNLLHVSSSNRVVRGFHGTHELSSNVLAMKYPKNITFNFQYLYTNAEIIFGPLYAWLVDQYEEGAITDVEIGYVPLTEEQKKRIVYIHPESAFSMLSNIALDAATAYYGSDYWHTLSTTPEVLIQPNLSTRRVLEMLRLSSKKRLFLLTNGSWEHTDVVMRCALGKDWRGFFDLVLTKASKDVFFESYHPHRFREVSIEPKATRSIEAVEILDEGCVYEGGNITELTQTLRDPKWRLHKNGENVLFIGDHPLHDVVNPTLSAAPWDTVAIIHETSLHFKYLEKRLIRTKQVETVIQVVLEALCPCASARKGPQVADVKPGPSMACFFFDCGGPYTYLGKLINRHAVLCVDSVSRLSQMGNTIQSLLETRFDRRRDSVRTSAMSSSSMLVAAKIQHQWTNVFRGTTPTPLGLPDKLSRQIATMWERKEPSKDQTHALRAVATTPTILGRPHNAMT